MESTAYEMLVLPIILGTFEFMAGCWLVSNLDEWASRIASVLFGRPDEVDGPEALRRNERDCVWSPSRLGRSSERQAAPVDRSVAPRPIRRMTLGFVATA